MIEVCGGCQLLDDIIRDLFESATANGQEFMTTPQQNRQPGREADQSGQCGFTPTKHSIGA